jgi:hypothetical protein
VIELIANLVVLETEMNASASLTHANLPAIGDDASSAPPCSSGGCFIG